MKSWFAIIAILLGFIALASVQAEPAHNPVIWADVPDVAVIRVGDTYYMSSTTMHMSPGLPIMKSKDLVNWEMLNYAYDRLIENDPMNLENGRSAYGRGSWASCLRYHNGTYYATTFSATSGRTHIYTTRDIEKGDWKASSFSPSLHDHTLFFDDDGRVYMIYGGGKLTLVELLPDLSGIKPGGVNEVIIENANLLFGEDEVGGLNGEGSQLTKVNGKYYLLNIASPKSRWSRSVLIHRADKIMGPYEGRVGLEDKGVAQGCLIDTPDGKWYAMLFQDNGSVGRSPWLVPVKWEDGWPVFGIDGEAPTILDIEDNGQGMANIVASDEFDRQPGEPLPLAWQWNHNPDSRFWSIGARDGYLRLTTGRVDSDVLGARNMLTQRTFGPVCSATAKTDVTQMKDGDYAGMIALQRRYGFVGVKMENGSKSIVMLSVNSDRSRQRGRPNQPSEPDEVESVPLTQSTVYFRIDCDFRKRIDKAYFYYSLDGETWARIGSVLQMAYTLPHFMGYRFGLFNMATQSAGGYVDFDYYRVSDEIAIVD
jgi:beta-xylosidase